LCVPVENGNREGDGDILFLASFRRDDVDAARRGTQVSDRVTDPGPKVRTNAVSTEGGPEASTRCSCTVSKMSRWRDQRSAFTAPEVLEPESGAERSDRR